MATTDHPLVMDLGPVIGPRGPEGPSGISSTTVVPTEDTGKNGDVRINVNDGTVYYKSGGLWSIVGFILHGPTSHSIDVGGTGVYHGSRRADRYGRLCDVVLTYDINTAASTPSEWTRSIDIGSTPQTATVLFVLPEAFRPQEDVHVMGWVRTEQFPYRAQYAILTTGEVYVLYICGFDYSPVQETEIDATGYHFKAMYFV